MTDTELHKTSPKDMAGRIIQVGDTIAYGLVVGRSANLAVYVVDEITHGHALGYFINAEGNRDYGSHIAPKLKARKQLESYGTCDGVKTSTIAMMERVLVINETAKVIFK